MDERAGGNKTKERRKEMKRGEQRRIWLDVRCVRLPGSTEPRKCQSHWIDGREAVHIFTVAISRRERERESALGCRKRKRCIPPQSQQLGRRERESATTHPGEVEEEEEEYILLLLLGCSSNRRRRRNEETRSPRPLLSHSILLHLGNVPVKSEKRNQRNKRRRRRRRDLLPLPFTWRIGLFRFSGGIVARLPIVYRT